MSEFLWKTDLRQKQICMLVIFPDLQVHIPKQKLWMNYSDFHGN